MRAGRAQFAAGFARRTTNHDLYQAEGLAYLIIGAIVAVIGIPLASSSTSIEVR